MPELSNRMAADQHFWRMEHISVNCFNYQVDSGDLLLFKGNNWSAKLNQFVQSSDYGKYFDAIK